MRKLGLAGSAMAVVLLFLVASTYDGPDSPTEREELTGNVVMGTVVVPNADEKRLAVMIDAADLDSALDGIADRLYILQTYDSPADVVDGFYPNTTVRYRSGELELRRRSNSAPFMRLSVSTVSGTQGGTVTIDGFGLSRALIEEAGFWHVTPEGLSPGQRAVLSVPCGGQEDECDAGGEGAGDCSIGGCSGSPSSCSVSGCDDDDMEACCRCSTFWGDAKCFCQEPA